MQIHQVGQFVSALLIGGGGLVIVPTGLYLLCKAHGFRDDTERQQLAWGFLFLLMGLDHLSSAFDLPHQESVRTNIVDWVTMPLAVVLVGYALHLQHRQRTKAKQPPA